MGREMAARLLAAGHSVSVYNRTAERAGPLAGQGARVCATPADAAAGAEIVISMVADDQASKGVWLGSEGALSGAPAGAVLVESSTLSRAWVGELAGAATAAGRRFLDCPVTGGPDGAAAGTLTLLVGGGEDVIAEVWPVLSVYANRVVRFGDIGAGTAYKVMVNLMGAVQGAALAEGLALAETAGLDLEKVKEALSSGAVASPHVKYLTERMIEGDHQDVYFALRWRWKDAEYGLRLADELEQGMETSRAAFALYARALEKIPGEENESAIIEVLRRGGEDKPD